jgi:hypothetical protein
MTWKVPGASGAVYSPEEETEPPVADSCTVHWTSVLDVPDAAAAKVALVLTVSVSRAGERVTMTGVGSTGSVPPPQAVRDMPRSTVRALQAAIRIGWLLG